MIALCVTIDASDSVCMCTNRTMFTIFVPSGSARFSLAAGVGFPVWWSLARWMSEESRNELLIRANKRQTQKLNESEPTRSCACHWHWKIFSLQTVGCQPAMTVVYFSCHFPFNDFFRSPAFTAKIRKRNSAENSIDQSLRLTDKRT